MPRTCGMTVGARGDLRLAQVVGGHRRGPGPRTSPRCGPTTSSSSFEGYAEHLGDGLAGDVVLGRTEPAAADHGVAASQGLADGGDDAGLVVTDLDLEVGVDAGEGQLFADPGRVGVDHLAEQQFRADGQDLAAHRVYAAADRSSRAVARAARAGPTAVEQVLGAADEGQAHRDPEQASGRCRGDAARSAAAG